MRPLDACGSTHLRGCGASVRAVMGLARTDRRVPCRLISFINGRIWSKIDKSTGFNFLTLAACGRVRGRAQNSVNNSCCMQNRVCSFKCVKQKPTKAYNSPCVDRMKHAVSTVFNTSLQHTCKRTAVSTQAGLAQCRGFDGWRYLIPVRPKSSPSRWCRQHGME